MCVITLLFDLSETRGQVAWGYLCPYSARGESYPHFSRLLVDHGQDTKYGQSHENVVETERQDKPRFRSGQWLSAYQMEEHVEIPDPDAHEQHNESAYHPLILPLLKDGVVSRAARPVNDARASRCHGATFLPDSPEEPNSFADVVLAPY